MPVAVRPYIKAPPGTEQWEYDVWGRRSDGVKFRERRASQLKGHNATLRFAEARLVQLLTAAPPRPVAPTFDELWPRYFETWCTSAGNRHTTASAKETIYRLHLKPKIGKLRIDALTHERVDQLKALFVERQSSGNNVLTVLNTMMTCAHEYGLIEKVPVKIRWFRRRRVRKPFYDFHEYEKLLLKSRIVDPRLELAILLGGDAALRRGEILALEQTDVDYDRGFLTIERQERRGRVGPPKGGVVGTIPTTDRLLNALRGHRHLRGPRVLYKDDGKTLDESTLRRWLARAQRLANLKETGPHILRHTAVSHMVMRGVNVRAVQEFARHADLKSTMGYMHLAPGHLEEAVRGRAASVEPRDSEQGISTTLADPRDHVVAVLHEK